MAQDKWSGPFDSPSVRVRSFGLAQGDTLLTVSIHSAIFAIPTLMRSPLLKISAYLPFSDASLPREVFETYIAGMRRWVKLAQKGDTKAITAADIPPVNVPPTPEWADKLRTRLDALEQLIRLLF